MARMPSVGRPRVQLGIDDLQHDVRAVVPLAEPAPLRGPEQRLASRIGRVVAGEIRQHLPAATPGFVQGHPIDAEYLARGVAAAVGHDVVFGALVRQRHRLGALAEQVYDRTCTRA